MREQVGVQQVRLVEEGDGAHPVAPRVLHVRLDGEEEVGRGRGRVQHARLAHAWLAEVQDALARWHPRGWWRP
ncbi:MAG: hypothetical protein IT371_28085 [Deltaproteobacteria bacterium]|nr:hypothetical protein [Deltaproteobacteria bacterium]